MRLETATKLAPEDCANLPGPGVISLKKGKSKPRRHTPALAGGARGVTEILIFSVFSYLRGENFLALPFLAGKKVQRNSLPQISLIF